MSGQFEDIPVGMLVKSKSGHDKGQVYVIVKKEETCLFVADGNLRRLAHPKRKNPKHLQVIHTCIDVSDDVRIKRGIKLYLGSQNKEKEECRKQM